MKIKLDSLMLNLFVVLNVLNGIIWEFFGLVFIGYYLLKNFFIKSDRINAWRVLAGMCVIWAIYVYIQYLILDLDFTSIIRLYGITKTICMPCVILLCFNSKSENRDIILTIYPAVMLIVVLAVIDYLFGTNFLTVGSVNYVGSICILILAYTLKEMSDKYKLWRTLFMLLTFIIVLVSGSRSVILAMVMVLVYTVLTEQDPRKKICYFSIAVVVAAILLFFVITLGINYDYNASRGGDTILNNISRALSVFTPEGRVDQARDDLNTRALAQYEVSSELQKMIGTGDNRVHIGMKPVHNCFLEVLLCYGVIGLVYYIVYLILLCRILIKESKDVKYTFLILLIALLFGLVQPFLTTGTVFQMIIGFVFLTCINKKNIYEFDHQKVQRKIRIVLKR